ncbi:DNA repair metallo-beta-lactamase [Rhizoctonia solani]|uniref:DNA repair metallo-beta-lactamase n=1 Tax=Rhizoctonia solani TaxID=456999 RepID=A0A8H8NRT3_9AGAM|nr:DNA repair metallo-beta-lactamase [Rhizoctonia solani]QRW17271.1 DNA repair metallo-beta-lactamase [Rhizoctonia solani]
MSTPEVSQKRKQDVAAEESHTLLSFFVSKRLKRDSVVPGPSVTPGTHKTGARKPDVIIISDDEGCIGTSPTEDVLDLSFSDPIDYHDHGIHAIEDDAIEDVDVPESSIAIPSETPRCLGNQLLASSVELRTCRVCGLVLLDSTAKEISDHIDECLAKPPKTSTEALIVVIPLQLDKKGGLGCCGYYQQYKTQCQANKFVGKAKVSTRTGDNPKKRKPAPFYKVMPGMPIAVDAFCYGKIPEVTAYFLSHAHSDHYTNLSSSWKNGPIYCSCEMDISVDSAGFNRLEAVTTANLIKHMLREVIAISRIYIAEISRVPAHALHPAIHGQKLDTVYLDTTYLNPKYCFPPQTMVINACAELAKRYIQEDKAIQTKNGKQKSLPALLINPAGKGGLGQHLSAGASGDLGRGVLVVVGTYTIGKERIVKAIAKSLSSKIYSAQVHVLPLGQITIESLSEYLVLNQAQYDRILGFRPTGWTYTPPVGQNIAPTIDQILSQAQAHEYTASDLRPQRGSNPRVTYMASHTQNILPSGN